VLDEYNLDIYGFSNDQAFPSSNRLSASYHIQEINPPSSSLHDPEVASLHSNTSDYYNFGGNQDYDNLYYNSSNTPSNNLDIN